MPDRTGFTRLCTLRLGRNITAVGPQGRTVADKLALDGIEDADLSGHGDGAFPAPTNHLVPRQVLGASDVGEGGGPSGTPSSYIRINRVLTGLHAEGDLVSRAPVFSECRVAAGPIYVRFSCFELRLVVEGCVLGLGDVATDLNATALRRGSEAAASG